jgi:hypothetical protein
MQSDHVSNSEIRKSGILLVQEYLLKRGIQSAMTTTGGGIDLVAFFLHCVQPITIQVKTNLRPKPGGGLGRMVLEWWISEKCLADFVALVDLETQCIWLIPQRELKGTAQQSSSGRLHIYFYTDPSAAPRLPRRRVHDFDQYLIDRQLEQILMSPGDKTV